MEKRQDWFYGLLIVMGFLSYQLWVASANLKESQERIRIQQERIDTTTETIDKLRGF